MMEARSPPIWFGNDAHAPHNRFTLSLKGLLKMKAASRYRVGSPT